MKQTIWLPTGTPVPGGGMAADTLAQGDSWQIVSTLNESRVLAVKPALRDRWVQDGYVQESMLEPLQTAKGLCYVFASRYGYMVSSVQAGPYPSQPSEAQLFAMSLRRMRKKLGDVSLHDALYIEQHSLVLPTYTEGREDDSQVLGRWLSGGVSISVADFDRLCELVAWMPRSEVTRVVKAAGIEPNEKGEAPRRQSGVEKGARFRLPGRPELENFFNENIVDLLANEEQYRRMGIEFPGAIVLYGPPGCGKTFAVERLVEFLGWPYYTMDSSTIGSTYIHDTGIRIAGMFDKAMKSAPAIIVIDEMEAFLSSRDTNARDTNRVEEVAEFLRRIPEASKNHVLVFGMTNRLEAIDSAILRRGRFDHLVEVRMPTAAEVQELLEAKFETLPVSSDVDVRRLAHKLEARPFSDVTFVLKEAGRLAVKRGLDEINTAVLNEAYSLLPDEKQQSRRRIGF